MQLFSDYSQKIENFLFITLFTSIIFSGLGLWVMVQVSSLDFFITREVFPYILSVLGALLVLCIMVSEYNKKKFQKYLEEREKDFKIDFSNRPKTSLYK